jgi:3' terminal RNA ribose 2'-O-methyltransferase Hen1
MLLTLATTHRPATDLGYLLHKHPDRVQAFAQSFGSARVFYPVANEDRCEACLLLDVDPVGLVRDRDDRFALGQYVNDRPYVASSFLSVAINDVFGTALTGMCKARPDLPATPLPLEARLDVVLVRGGEVFLRAVFEPLGYEVMAEGFPLDPTVPEWGLSRYFSVTVRKTCPLADLLNHLYVLVPVFDGRKHYYVGPDELEKLLARGEGWLAGHPAREQIVKRYLQHRPNLYREALERLDEGLVVEDGEDTPPVTVEVVERALSLHDQRLDAVCEVLIAAGAKSVLDLGCGEGRLLKRLLAERQFERIVGADVSPRSLEIAADRLRLDRLPASKAGRVTLLQASALYHDKRFESFDAAAVVEVIEHLEPPRLAAFGRVVFEFARPQTVVLTTPNREYNAVWETLSAGDMRHGDHRFEWSRAEFEAWANAVAARFGYAVELRPVGPVHEVYGPPSQMGVFSRGQ